MATKTLPQYKIANQELFHNYKKNQDLQTRNEIIHLNLGLVKKEVKRIMMTYYRLEY